MRIISAALAALFFLTLASGTANARERARGFTLGSNMFGAFTSRSKVQRLRRKRARLRRASRYAGPRRSAKRRAAKRRTAHRAKIRRAKARRAKVRRAKVRRAKTRRAKARRAKVRRAAIKRRAKPTVRRRKVVRRGAPKRNTKVASKPASKAKRFARQTVSYKGGETPGTIVVDTKTRHLYYVLPKRKAIRYGVAVGKEGFAWSGVSRVRRKVEWPTWTPPSEMIERKPELAEFRSGMPGGPENPLGSRALYLFQGKKDTLYRIHGTNKPSSIGRAASSGCIRMRNDDVAHLYARVKMGSKVIVR